MSRLSKSNMSSIEPAMLSKLDSLIRAPFSQLSSMKRRIEVKSASALLT